MAGSLFGLIICIKRRFQTIPPSPKAITKRAVTLFLDYGNWVHMQFKIGIELSAKAEPGMTIENRTNVKGVNTKILVKGARKKSKQQIRMTSS